MKLRYLGKLYQAYYPVPAALQIVNCAASGSISGVSSQVGAADAEAAVSLEHVDGSIQSSAVDEAA